MKLSKSFSGTNWELNLASGRKVENSQKAIFGNLTKTAPLLCYPHQWVWKVCSLGRKSERGGAKKATVYPSFWFSSCFWVSHARLCSFLHHISSSLYFTSPSSPPYIYLLSHCVLQMSSFRRISIIGKSARSRRRPERRERNKRKQFCSPAAGSWPQEWWRQNCARLWSLHISSDQTCPDESNSSTFKAWFVAEPIDSMWGVSKSWTVVLLIKMTTDDHGSGARGSSYNQRVAGSN